jgi:[acyl-carrier-protein] S-malonyltransferase
MFSQTFARCAFVFPGQGSQHQGMGTDLYGSGGTYRRLIERASQLSGTDLAEALDLAAAPGPGGIQHPGAAGIDGLGDSFSPLGTQETQLSVLALSIALAEVLSGYGLRPDVVAGHSLGEFSALVAGGWLDADEALSFVAARARAMAECCSAHDGTMTAVLGLAPSVVDDLVARTAGAVVVANRNSPKQSVLSGRAVAVRRIAEASRTAGATAVIDLPVAGAFHSPLMSAAQAALAGLVDALSLRTGHTALISSIDGMPVTDVERYRATLQRQVCAPVEWQTVMQSLRTGGVGTIVEVGPGRVLRGLFRQFDRALPIASCQTARQCRDLAASRSQTEPDDIAAMPPLAS